MILRKKYIFTFWLYKKAVTNGEETVFHEIVPVSIVDGSLESAEKRAEEFIKKTSCKELVLKEIREVV